MDDPPKESPPAETFEHSRARLLAALLETHHITFYTVISVIQATCFGFLALVCFEEGKHYGPAQWLLAANTLVILVLVWNGFIRGFVILSYVPKLADGGMPFALGAAQCFAAYYVAHDARGWYWSMAALCFIGFLGYVNAEVNAKLNPLENAHIMVFYGRHLRVLQVSALFLSALCGGIAYGAPWSNETLALLSLPLIVGYAIGDEVLWVRLERFARGRGGSVLHRSGAGTSFTDGG
jgi:hypothetical protein